VKDTVFLVSHATAVPDREVTGRFSARGDGRPTRRTRSLVAAGRLAHVDVPVASAAAVSTMMALIALYASYRGNLILAYGDAASHLDIARHVLDSRTPGIAQLGTIWLPVPHLLMQPFIYSDVLWRSGLAGSIVGLLCFVTTALTLFLSIRLITRHSLAAWIGLAVFISNPNALYMQTTALTEPVLLMSTTASGYFLLRWSKRHAHGDLLAAGLLAALGVGSRYDGWFFFLVCAPTVALIAYLERRDPVRTEGLTLAYGAFPAYAMFLWFFYNWLIWGDPLQFNRGKYSAAGMNGVLINQLAVSTRHNLLLSTLTYSWCLLDNLGLLTSALAMVGFATYVMTTRFRPDSLAVYPFLSAAPFNIIALWMGQTLILVPQTHPAGYFNVRYGVLALPAAAVFIAYFADVVAQRLRPAAVGGVMALILVAQAALWIPGWPTSIVTVADGLYGVSSGTSNGISGMQAAAPAARYFREHYRGGGALVFNGDNPWFFTETGLDFHEYIDVYNGALWTLALQDPAPYARWVVLRPGFDTDMATLRSNPNFIGQYTLRYQAHGYAVYGRIVPNTTTLG